MPRPCTICIHDQRADIDRALAAGKPFRYVADSFGTSRSAAFRHKRDHLAPQLALAIKAAEGARAADLVREREARKAQEIGEALDVVRQLQAINGACLEILKNSRKNGQDSLSLRAVDRIHRQIELQARLLGELQEGSTVNVLVAPQWQQIRQVILVALERHPEARAEVVEALKGVTDGSA